MTKRLTSVILCAAIALSLCGCGSVFDKEYYSVSNYVRSADASQDGKSQVKNYYGLKQAILQLVEDHNETGVVSFGEYDGDVSTDLSNACWELRTQNALCAYCVESINYELNHIVAFEEASVYITYSRTESETEQIVKVSYSTGIRDYLESAITNLQGKVVLLVKNSALDEDGVKNLVADIYTKDPVCAVNEPQAAVYMYSGSGLERLFEVNLSYGAVPAVLNAQKVRLNSAVDTAAAACTANGDDKTALAICMYLAGRCNYRPDSGGPSAYDALVTESANSRGLALAFKALCNELGIQCSVVTGLLDTASHWWNMIKLGDDYYHVDISRCITDGCQAGFLRGDKDMWGLYKWDAASYPECRGSLTYDEVAG